MSARIETLADVDAVAARARDLVLGALDDARRAGRVPTLCLSGGSTPERLYRLFATTTAADTWRDVHVFYGDERAVPPDHADSNHGMAMRAWLGTGMVSTSNIHCMRGDAPDLDLEALRLSRELDDVCGPARGMEVMLLGMGEDAHTASLFPGTPVLEARGRVTVLHHGAPKHPRLTVTLDEMARVGRVLVLATGAAKAPVLERVLGGPVDVNTMPIQAALRLHPNCTLLRDVSAAG